MGIRKRFNPLKILIKNNPLIYYVVSQSFEFIDFYFSTYKVSYKVVVRLQIVGCEKSQEG